MKKRILSSYAFVLSLSASIQAWSELPNYNAIKSIQTYGVGQDPSSTEIMIINHNKNKHVLLVKKDHSAFAVADLSINITDEEAITHLEEQYFSVDNVSFFENYPAPPDDLFSYSELGFSNESLPVDFKVFSQRIILEAKAFLSSHNLIVPWQEGYAAYSLADDYIAVDDVDDSYVNGYYRCPLSGWNESTDIIEKCTSIPSLDFHNFTSSTAKYYGMTASNKSYIQDENYVLNLENGSYLAQGGSFSYSTKPVVVTFEDDSNKNQARIKIYQNDDLDVVEKEGVFAPNVKLWSNSTLLAVLEGNRAIFTTDTDLVSIASCQLEYGNIDLMAQNMTINGMFTSSFIDQPELAMVFGNYPNKPDNIDAANEILGTNAGFILTESMTNREFKLIVDDSLNEAYLEWRETTELEHIKFKENHQGQYFYCGDSINIESGHLGAARLGSYISSNGYLFGTSLYTYNDGSFVTSTFSHSNDNGIQILSERIYDLLTEDIPVSKINTIIEDIKINNDENYGTFPEPPVLVSEDHRLLYLDSMYTQILSTLGYVTTHGLASVSADGSSIFLGNLTSRPSNVPLFTGRGSTQSYLIYNEEPKNIVRIIPSRLTIDPYDDASLNTRIEIETEGLYGADLNCAYDSNSLAYQSGDYGSLFPDLPLGFRIPIVPLDGAWLGRATLLGSPVGITGVDTFADITYNAAYTTAEIELSCTATLSDAEGNALPVVVESATIKIDDGIHGLVGESGNVEGSIDLPSSVEGQEVTVTVSIDGRSISSSSLDGSFSFEQLRDGVFTMTVNSDNHVAACTTVEIINGEVVSVEELELIAGDVTGDGIIDIGDISAVSAKYGLTSSDDAFDEIMDLNRDGLINIQDISIIGSHFNSANCIQ